MTDEDKMAALRAATREANEALKDLVRERREVEQLIRSIPDVVRRAFEARVEETITNGLAGYDQTIREAMDAAVKRVNQQFDRLAGHRDRAGDPGLPARPAWPDAGLASPRFDFLTGTE